METNSQREERVIKRTLDSYVENYHYSDNDKDRKEIDGLAKVLIVGLVPESYSFYWDYYQAKKREE